LGEKHTSKQGSGADYDSVGPGMSKAHQEYVVEMIISGSCVPVGEKPFPIVWGHNGVVRTVLTREEA